MDKPKDREEVTGVFLKGVTISNSARLVQKRDNSGQVVIVSHEFALKPGVAVWNRYFDPKDIEIRLSGEEVTTFPKFKEFEPIELRLNRFKKDENRLNIQAAEVITR